MNPENEQTFLLNDLLRNRIDRSNGWIPFDLFFNTVMYEPGLGYYSSGSYKIGEGGDYTTAPEISKYFSKSIANQTMRLLDMHDSPSVIEIGAGKGTFAFEYLKALRETKTEIEHYYILEISADLRDRQMQLISGLPEDLRNKVTWLESLDIEPIDGIVLANEVIDALPFKRFCIENKQVYELGITYSDGAFKVSKKESSKKLRDQVEAISVEIERKIEDGFTSEIRLDFHKWFRSISSLIRKGSMIFIDYGYDRNDFYRPERSSGNMICHYQNQIIQDPLKNIGQQDISASVDFTQLANSAIEEGFFIDLFTTQSMFLLSEQSLSMIMDIDKDEERIMEIQKLKQLVMPNQMGDVFKCMVMGKGISPDNFEELSHLNHTL